MVCVGDDWAEDHHDVELVDDAGRRLARARLPEGLDGITRLHALIAQHMPTDMADLDPAEAAGEVKIGIETDRGPWVQALVAADRHGSTATRWCRWPSTPDGLARMDSRSIRGSAPTSTWEPTCSVQLRGRW